MKRTLLGTILLSMALSGCGGAPPPAPDKKPEAPAASGDPKEAACLKQAANPGEPRKDAPEKITISHVLVRHADLKRPEGATRTRGQACLRAEEAREKLLGGAEWADVVKSYSDASEATGGSLGTVGKDELDPTFGEAAFSLGVGELSHVVETSRGFHVIVRTE